MRLLNEKNNIVPDNNFYKLFRVFFIIIQTEKLDKTFSFIIKKTTKVSIATKELSRSLHQIIILLSSCPQYHLHWVQLSFGLNNVFGQIVQMTITFVASQTNRQAKQKIAKINNTHSIRFFNNWMNIRWLIIKFLCHDCFGR